MYMAGPYLARLLLNAFVVVIGFLILAGAVNTAIIGSNGVLNRVAEDGVMPDWFLKPHRRYGTTHRILYLIVALQLLTILLSGGNMDMLGEAYAFGVVWSFVFKALAMIVLRFKRPQPPRVQGAAQFPRRRSRDPLRPDPGLPGALLHGLAEPLDQGSGHDQRLGLHGGLPGRVHDFGKAPREAAAAAAHHKHVEQFNQKTAAEINPEELSLDKPYRKLVAIRSTNNLFMLEKTLAETDPERPTWP